MRKRTTTVVMLTGTAVLALADVASAYYSPRLGRFLSRDPLSEPGAALVRQVSASTSFLPRDPVPEPNAYLSFKNSPLSWFDPDGLAAATQPATQPASPVDTIELYCNDVRIAGAKTPYMHCDIKCTRGTDGSVLWGGGSGPVSSGTPVYGAVDDEYGNPRWVTGGPVMTSKGKFSGRTTARAGTCDCLDEKGKKLNNIKGKYYDLPGVSPWDGNLSNSNAVASTVLTCCGVSITPTSSRGPRNAAGWGHQVEWSVQEGWYSSGQPGFGPSFTCPLYRRGRITCKDLQ